MPGNSQNACPCAMSELVCATALSILLGKSTGDEKSAHTTLPLSLCNPATSTRMRLPCDDWACAKTAEKISKKAPESTSISRQVAFSLKGTSPFASYNPKWTHTVIWY